MEEPHESPSLVDPSPSAGECDIAADHSEITSSKDEGLALPQAALVALSGYPTIDPSMVHGLPPGHKVDGAHLYHQHEQNIDSGANIIVPLDMYNRGAMNGRNGYQAIRRTEDVDYVYLKYAYQDWFYFCGNNRTIIHLAASLINTTWDELTRTVYTEFGCEASLGDWPVPYSMRAGNERKACQALMRKCLEIVHDHLPPLQPVTGIAQSVYTL